MALVLGAGLVLLFATDVGFRQRGSTPDSTPAAGLSGLPPTPEPLRFLPITPEQAIVVNATTPVSARPNPAARPFALQTLFELDRLRAIECLTAAIYYEAATEPLDGQRGVAQVVLNRARHPAYPNSICGVVYQGSERRTGCQFSFTCDGSLNRVPSPAGWRRAREVAEAALGGHVHAPVGWATHYHADYVVPYWASSLDKIVTVGRHIFYRWKGRWGTPRAFGASYAGAEPEALQIGDLVDEPAAELIDGATPALDGTVLPTAEPGSEPNALEAEIRSFGSAVMRATPPRPAEPTTGEAAQPNKQAASPPPAAYRSALTRQPTQPSAGATAGASAVP